jgi:HPt (histidine-containing phosphotransfer) domain-containing protein
MMKAFEPARLVEVFDGDPTAINEVIEETLSLMRDIIARLSSETGADARSRCTALIHELKGLSGNVGAQEMYALSQDIEARLLDSSHGLNRQWLAELVEPHSRFLASVNEYLTRGS